MSTGGAGGTAGGVATARFAARFDLSKAQLPEGLAIGNGVPYVGLAVTSEIAKVNLSDGTLATFATLPKPAPNTGFMTGLALSAKDPGVLYAALVSFAPEVQPGIYRVGASGGAASLFAKDAGMVFPNGLFADDAGNWFVADSAAGAVFRIAASGQTVEKWATDDLLLGDKDHSCASAKGAGLPFNIGANGIVKSGDAFYVSNTDKGLVARIPVGSDGTAGKVTAFAGPDCDKLGGADGVTILGTDLYVAANFLNQIVRVGSAGDVTVVASGEPLDFPASLAFEGAALYASNFAFTNAQAMKGSPGLIRIDLPASH
jgi:sugar lactone lactonase YvrE